MSSHVVRLISPRVAVACVVVLAFSACQRGAQETDTGPLELAWARAALERNPQIEVVASDAQSRVFTVRYKQNGEVQVVKLDEIAAAPLAQILATATAQSFPAPQEPAQAQPETSPPPEDTAPAVAQRSVASAMPSAPAQSTSADAGYTIERMEGQLRVTGPGVSIVSSGQPAGNAKANAGVRSSEPVICEGQRMVHFDNRDIHVEGDAIIVRDGCEMFITNSRIVASGTGVTVRNAVVHVSNSHIEGAQGSFDADAASKMYVRGSTFLGLSRRDQLAMVQDQGGNKWR